MTKTIQAPDFWKKVAEAGSLSTTTTPVSASTNVADFWKKVQEGGSLPITATPLGASSSLPDFWMKVAAQGVVPTTSTLVAFINEADYWAYVAANGIMPISVGNVYANARDLWHGIATGTSGASDTTAPTCVITCAQTSPSATTPLNFTFTFSEVVTGFAIGDITAVDSAGNALTKSNFAGSGAVYTCDITPTGMSTLTVDVSAGVCVDGAGNANAAATQFPFTSTAPFSDAFTRTDGAIGSIWTGATWTIAGNAALNTPTLGAELLPNPGFEGTYEDESGGGGGTIMVAPNWDNQNCETDGTDTLNESATAHGGSKSQLINANANAEGVKTTANVMAAIGWYQISAWVNITSGTARLTDDDGNIIKTTSTTGSWVNIVSTGRTSAVNKKLYTVCGGGAANFLVDDASVKLITLASTFATLPNVSVANVTAQAVITVNPVSHKAGLVINLDSISSPANFVIAYLDGIDGTITAKLVKCVAGTYTQVISGGVIFGATKYLKVVKSGDNYSLYYGTTDVQVGTTQTIASMNGTIHGMFSTHSTPILDTYALSATP